MEMEAFNQSVDKLQQLINSMIPVMGQYEKVFSDAKNTTDKLIKSNAALAKSYKPTIESVDDLTYAQSKLVDKVRDGKYFTEAGLQVDKYGQAITATGEKVGSFNKRTQILNTTIKQFASKGEAVPFLEGLSIYLKQGGTSLEYFAEFLSSGREELTIFGLEAAKARKFMYGFLPRGMFRTLNKFSSTMQFAGGIIRKSRDANSGLNDEIERLQKLTKDPVMLLPENAEDLSKIKDIIAELQAEQIPSVFGKIFNKLEKITEFAKKPVKLRFETDVLFQDMVEVEEVATTTFGKIKKFFKGTPLRLTPNIEDKRVMKGIKNISKKMMELSPFGTTGNKTGIEMPKLFDLKEREQVKELKKKIKTINKSLKSGSGNFDFAVQFNTPEMKDIINEVISEAKITDSALNKLKDTRLALADAESKLATMVEKNGKRRLEINERLETLSEKQIATGRISRMERREQFKLNQELNKTISDEITAKAELTNINLDYKESIKDILSATKEDLENLNKKGKEKFTDEAKRLGKSAKEYAAAFAGIIPIANKLSSFQLNTTSDVAKQVERVDELKRVLKDAKKTGDPTLVANAENNLADAKQRVNELNAEQIKSFQKLNKALMTNKETLSGAKEALAGFNLNKEQKEETLRAFGAYQSKLENLQKIEEKLTKARLAGSTDGVEVLTEKYNEAFLEAQKLKDVADNFGDAEEIVRLTEQIKNYEEVVKKSADAQNTLLKEGNMQAFAIEFEAIKKVIKEKEKNIKVMEKEISLNEKQMEIIQQRYTSGEITEADRDAQMKPLTEENTKKKQQIEQDKGVIAEKQGEKSNAKDMLKQFKGMRKDALVNLLKRNKFFRIAFTVIKFFGGIIPLLKFLLRGIATSFVVIGLAIIALFLIIKKAWPVLSAAFEKAWNFIKPVFDLMSYFLGVVFSGVADVVNGFFGDGGLEGIIEGLVKIAYGLLGFVITFAFGVYALAIAFLVSFSLEIWGKAKDFFSEAFGSAKGFFKNVGLLLAMVGVIVLLFTTAPIWLVAVIGVALWYIGNWMAKKISKIFDLDFFAKGGTSSGGLAVVGEEGPELVNLPAGATVHSNKESGQMVGSKGNNSVTNNFNITINAKDTSDGEMKRIADKIGKMINNKINRNVGASSIR